MTVERTASTNTEFVWRFIAGWLLALGLIGIGAIYAWHYWFVVRSDGYDWCYYEGPDGGLDEPRSSVVTWLPVGVRCTYYVSDETYQLPGFGPTLIVLAGLAALVIAVMIPIVQAIARRRTDTARRQS